MITLPMGREMRDTVERYASDPGCLRSPSFPLDGFVLGFFLSIRSFSASGFFRLRARLLPPVNFLFTVSSRYGVRNRKTRGLTLTHDYLFFFLCSDMTGVIFFSLPSPACEGGTLYTNGRDWDDLLPRFFLSLPQVHVSHLTHMLVTLQFPSARV